jgi:hypothetical protein
MIDFKSNHLHETHQINNFKIIIKSKEKNSLNKFQLC